MKSILYNQLLQQNFKPCGFSNHLLEIECENCFTHYQIKVKKFLVRKHRHPVCHDCYFKLYVFDAEWRAKNSQAQKIAQNRPEVLEKQRQSQKERYERGGEEIIKHYQEIGKKLWEDPEYRAKQKDALTRNWKDPEFRHKIFSHYKQYIGEYKGNRYYSLVEFAFLLWCEERDIKVKNYDGLGIKYVFQGQNKIYYPDYIVNDDTIVEVKGLGRWYEKHRKQIEAKNLALTSYCRSCNMKSRLVFNTDLGTILWKKAKKLHLSQEQNNETHQKNI